LRGGERLLRQRDKLLHDGISSLLPQRNLLSGRDKLLRRLLLFRWERLLSRWIRVLPLGLAGVLP
jgi:hypothetical protein